MDIFVLLVLKGLVNLVSTWLTLTGAEFAVIRLLLIFEQVSCNHLFYMDEEHGVEDSISSKKDDLKWLPKTRTQFWFGIVNYGVTFHDLIDSILLQLNNKALSCFMN